jgi:predicted nuclease with TOPRIM domain
MSNDKRKEKRQKELINLGRQAKEIQERLDDQIEKNTALAKELHETLAQVRDQEETRIALDHAAETIDTLRAKLTAAQDETMNARIKQLELVDLLEKYRARLGEVDALEKENAKLRKRLQKRGAALNEANTTIARLRDEARPC